MPSAEHHPLRFEGSRKRTALPAGLLAAGPAAAPAPVVAALLAALLAGCAAVDQINGVPRPPKPAVTAAEAPRPEPAARVAPRSAGASDQENLGAANRVRMALAADNLDAAEAALARSVTTVPAGQPNAGAIVETPDLAELLVLRAELHIRRGRYREAETDAYTAMALVPATAPAQEAPSAAPADDKSDADAAPKRPPLTRRSIELRLAQLFEDAGQDHYAIEHITASHELCAADAALVEKRECEREREALIRIHVAAGKYELAEKLVLAEIADVQQRFGVYDLRYAVAFCKAARFYARQGKYTLAMPLFTRSFDLWKTSREEAFAEHTRALAAAQPSPFDAEFLRPRAGHAPFAVPCGLDEQPALLYKLGKPDVAAEAIRYSQQLWAGDTEAGTAALAYLAALEARGADPLDVASARHAVAWIALNKNDAERAELELRQVTEAYAAAWPGLSVSERRYRVEDYLRALESLAEILRATRRFPEAIALGERAAEVAAGVVDAYDSLRLDTLLSLAKTYRELRDPVKAEESAAGYLDAIVAARGDRSADYAWALRTISYAYLLKDEFDASQRMEMQAKAIWAKQGNVAPAF